MICPNCGVETEGKNHNGRGLRCTNCWSLLPAPDEPAPSEAEEPVVEEAKTPEQPAKEAPVEPAPSEAEEPVVIDLSDGVSEAEASTAGQALNQKKKQGKK